MAPSGPGPAPCPRAGWTGFSVHPGNEERDVAAISSATKVVQHFVYQCYTF